MLACVLSISIPAIFLVPRIDRCLQGVKRRQTPSTRVRFVLTALHRVIRKMQSLRAIKDLSSVTVQKYEVYNERTVAIEGDRHVCSQATGQVRNDCRLMSHRLICREQSVSCRHAVRMSLLSLAHVVLAATDQENFPLSWTHLQKKKHETKTMIRAINVRTIEPHRSTKATWREKEPNDTVFF